MGQAETQGIASPVDLSSRESRLGWAGLYVYGLAGLTLVLLCVLVYAQMHWPALHPNEPFSWGSFVILLSAGLVAEMYTTPVGSGAEASAGSLVVFNFLANLSPHGGFIIAVTSQLLGLKDRQWGRTLCYAATMGFLSGSTSLLYWAALTLVGGFADSSVVALAGIGLGVGILYHLLNFALVAPVMWLRRGVGLRETWGLIIRPFLPFALFFLAISLSLISIYQVYSGQRLAENGSGAGLYATLLVVVSLLPVFGLIYAFRAYAQQRELAKSNARLARRNERLALQAVASQITALDLKDDYTARHSAAVAQWASDIAEAMGLGERERNLTHLASLLHDVGKIGIPDEVLKSPVKLDRVNWSLIEGHCYNGYKILKNIDEFDELATVVLHHHERFDGTGYPRGLAGERIPLASRIICVADSYSAMVSNRPYGPALLPEIGMAELELHKGTQFDPEVVECFLTILDAFDDRYRRGEEADFHMEVQQVKFLRDLPPEAEDDTAAVAISRQGRHSVRHNELHPRPVLRVAGEDSSEKGSSSSLRIHGT
jgi:putative nucleotidyltransferase with HDIG domain